jgi:hypothetical protein
MKDRVKRKEISRRGAQAKQGSTITGRTWRVAVRLAGLIFEVCTNGVSQTAYRN